MSKPWFLYLIECRDGSIYTGITLDVAARYAAHCTGRGARYTRSHPPLRLLAWESHADRAAASRAEYRIKQLSAAEKRLYATQLTQAEQCRAAASIPPSESSASCSISTDAPAAKSDPSIT